MFTQFEYINCQIREKGSSTSFLAGVIYRPPPSKDNGFTTKEFIEEWSDFLEQISISVGEILIIGDINLHLEKTQDTYVGKFLALLEAHDLKQHITCATHVRGHTLDIVVSRTGSPLLWGNPEVTDPCIGTSSGSSLLVHNIIHFNLAGAKRPDCRKTVQSRKLNKLPLTIRQSATVELFKKHLKTHLFRLEYC